MLRIAVVGPESSGKSTLCAALAGYFDVSWVSEYARAYLAEHGARYHEADLLRIAEGQCAREDGIASRSGPLLICDTDMITIRIWSEEVFKHCAPRLKELADRRGYDHWLLCRPDIPWEPDPLRENPHDRDRLFGVYERMLTRMRRPFTVVEGAREERLKRAISAIDRLIERTTD